MDNLRLVLLFGLAGVCLMIYQAWLDDYAQPAPASSVSQQVDPLTESDSPLDQPPLAPSADVPMAPVDGAATVAPSDASSAAPIAPGIFVDVETDVLRVQISPRGGQMMGAWLKDYAVTADRPDEKVRLFKPNEPNYFVGDAALIGNGTDTGVFRTSGLIFTPTQPAYNLPDNSNSLIVEMSAQTESGLTLIKRYQFDRGSYVVRVTQEVANGTKSPIAVRDSLRLTRSEFYDPNAPRFLRTYAGAVYYTPEEKYQKEPFKELAKARLETTSSDSWVAMIQHYFIAAWIPPAGVSQQLRSDSPTSDHYRILTQRSEPIVIAPGASHAFESRLFVGPKLHDELEATAPGLALAIDYGWLTIISEPIFWLMRKIHDLVGNWGWSIIVLTILIKLAFYKLSETSYKSMAHMREFTPRLQAMKERYGDDKEKFNKAMMELYQKEKINPLGGCLPILIQIPVFIALYYVLLESIELRHAPFVFWLDNLTSPDPYFILPLIMGVSMFVQQKLNPPPPDPMQAKIMMSLPFVFTIFFSFFPSGLVLYWTVNNLLSITQQWYITRTIEKASAKKAHG